MVPEAKQPGLRLSNQVVGKVPPWSGRGIQHVKLLYYIRISLSRAYSLLFGHQEAQENWNKINKITYDTRISHIIWQKSDSTFLAKVQGPPSPLVSRDLLLRTPWVSAVFHVYSSIFAIKMKLAARQ